MERLICQISALALAGFCLGAHLVGAEEVPLQNCVEILQPIDQAQLQSVNAAIGLSRDVGNITLMELQGEYDRGLSAPRQLVAERFYQSHADSYDFLIVFTTFEFETDGAHAFYNGIKNDVAGVGASLYDNSANYASAGRLQGYLDMAALARNSFAIQDDRFQFTLQVLAHELMHRWGSRLTYLDDSGVASQDLLGPDQSHWSYFLDTDASVMYGNDWATAPGSEFRSVAIRHRYSSLDMYAAGFMAPSEVAPLGLIRGGVGNATDLPRLGATTPGSLETISIDQVVAASGDREPSSAHSQKDFRAAFIVLTRPGETLPAATAVSLEQFRIRAQQYFAQITQNRASLRIFSEGRPSAAVGLPQILIGSGSTPSPPGIAGAVSWVESRLRADGHWQDHDSTALRDTLAAIELIQERDPDFAGLRAARAWLERQHPENLDHAARRFALELFGKSTTLFHRTPPSGDCPVLWCPRNREWSNLSLYF